MLTGLGLEQQRVHDVDRLIRILGQHADQRDLPSLASRLDTLTDTLRPDHFDSDVDAGVVGHFEDFCRPFWMSAVVDEMGGSKFSGYLELLIR